MLAESYNSATMIGPRSIPSNAGLRFTDVEEGWELDWNSGDGAGLGREEVGKGLGTVGTGRERWERGRETERE